MDVSVIVPIFNAQREVANLINQLHEQRKKDCEFIIVNDGSEDETSVIIKRQLNLIKDNRFVYYEFDTNHGVSNARNKGIELAKGKYLLFIDSDDSFKNDLVSNYFNQIESNQTDIEFFSFNSGNDLKYVDYSILEKKGRISSSELLDLFFNQYLRTFLFSFISKSSLWNSRSFDTSITYEEDTLALMLIIINNKIVAHFNGEAYYCYNNQNVSSTSNNLRISQYWEGVEVNKYLEKQIYLMFKDPLLIKRMHSKELSELMGVIRASLFIKSRDNYDKARTAFIDTYQDSLIINKKTRLKRFIQYILLNINSRRILKLIYKATTN